MIYNQIEPYPSPHPRNDKVWTWLSQIQDINDRPLILSSFVLVIQPVRNNVILLKYLLPSSGGVRGACAGCQDNYKLPIPPVLDLYLDQPLLCDFNHGSLLIILFG